MNRSRELARILLQKARDDAYIVRQGCEDNRMPGWIFGFHAQQAVEKALKAVLIDKRIQYPHTHNLTTIMVIYRQQSLELPPDAEEMDRLNPYGIMLRYEDQPVDFEEAALDRSWVMACVERTLSWAAR